MSARTSAYFSFKSFDAFARQAHQFRVVRHRLARGIVEIGQQGKMQMRVAIGQIAHLQPVQQFARCRGAGEHRGHDDQSCDVREECLAEIHPRQRLRAERAASPASCDAATPNCVAQISAGQREQRTRKARTALLNAPGDRSGVMAAVTSSDDGQVTGQRKSAEQSARSIIQSDRRMSAGRSSAGRPRSTR